MPNEDLTRVDTMGTPHASRTASEREGDSWTVERGWIERRGPECLITIEPRPSYCDRGRYIAKLFPTAALALDIDGQDLWPRYYFDLERAKAECDAWLEKRAQRRPSITCPICHRVSYNLNDIAQRYCGQCHRFHDDPVPAA